MSAPAETFTIHHETMRNQDVYAPDDGGRMFRFDGNGDCHGVDRVNAGLWLAMPRYSTPQGRARIAFTAAAIVFGNAMTAFKAAQATFVDAIRAGVDGGESMNDLGRIAGEHIKHDLPPLEFFLNPERPEVVPTPAPPAPEPVVPAAAVAPEAAVTEDEPQELTLEDLEASAAKAEEERQRLGEDARAEIVADLWADVLGRPWRAQVALAQEMGRKDITTKTAALDFVAGRPAREVRAAMVRMAVAG